ncbi:unnamed protein product [Mucor circinelloides]
MLKIATVDSQSNLIKQSRQRRIIVCLDGTWETPQEKTNVYKFYNNISLDNAADGWEYITGYYPGLGTNGHFPLLGGIFGYGISNQIINAYEFICRNYKASHDEIWLIGFSRGAYAARSLSGMIYNVGLLPKDKLSNSNQAYELYRDRCDASRPMNELAIKFRQDNQCRLPLIHFLGCFDTVGALGVPKLPWYLGGSTFYSLFLGLHGFHDTKLTPIVRNAYHAISIHDQRAWFSPTLMHFSEVAPDHHQSLEQVWFPGMHGDVGGQEVGTYNNLLSCHSLHWMMNRARKNGLKFKNNETTCSSANHHFIYDDSYNSSIIYKLMPRQDRVIAKDEVTDDYRLSQLYENGEFSSYLTQEQLSMYKSKTLKEFYKHYNDQ